MTRREGYDGVVEASERLPRMMEDNGGSLPVCDSLPLRLLQMLATGMSKKLFAKALGGLLREGVAYSDDGG